MSNDIPVSIELHHEIEQHLFHECRVLDAYDLRGWIERMVDPAIRYQVFIREERFRKDRRPKADAELYLYDDSFEVLGMRVRQFESGLQTMLDPLQRLRRLVTNVSAFAGDEAGRYRVLSYGYVSRSRRLYEAETVVFSRDDTLQRDGEGKLRLLTRRVELDERVSRNKNLLFFM